MESGTNFGTNFVAKTAQSETSNHTRVYALAKSMSNSTPDIKHRIWLIVAAVTSGAILLLPLGVSSAADHRQESVFPFVATSAISLPHSRVLLPMEFSNASDGSLETGLAVIQADGSLDPNFGDGGIVLTPTALLGEDWGNQIALDRQKRILFVSTSSESGDPRAGLTRLLPNGTPDSSFGNNGNIMLNLGGRFSTSRSVAVESDGDILVGGHAGPPCSADPRADCAWFPAVARLHENGAPDRSFGHNGHRLFNPRLAVQGEPSVLAIASAPGGKIVVATGHKADMEIHRLGQDGSVDRSFGNRGVVLLRQAGRGPATYGSVFAVPQLGVTRNGKIVVAGESAVGIGSGHPYRFEMVAVRYRASGALDRSFGNRGRVFLHLARQSFSSGFIMRKNGGLILSGHGYGAKRSYLMFAALTKNGTLDRRFSRKGRLRIGFPRGGGVTGVGLIDRGSSVVAVGNRARTTVLTRIPYPR